MPSINRKTNSEENFSVNLWGAKLEFKNPGMPTYIILSIVFLFFLLLILILKIYIIPLLLGYGGNKSSSLIISSIKKLFQK